MAEPIQHCGFAAPIAENSSSSRRSIGVQVIATVALAASLAVAATAVSIGMARAQSPGAGTALLLSVPHSAPIR